MLYIYDISSWQGKLHNNIVAWYYEFFQLAEIEKQASSLQEEIEKVGKINSAAETTMEANAALKDKLEVFLKVTCSSYLHI